MKRLFDFLASAVGLLILSPVLLTVMLFVWLQDFHSPFYIAPRVRRKGQTFRMVKLRSMVVSADEIGGVSTSATDRRITSLGRFIRRYKLDEFMQLWNVLKGEMSLVGPRPQVPRDVALYTDTELHLLDAKPGITDFASIVFSDEGDILRGSENPDLKYNQVIRPWKSRLGLFYVDHQSVWMDVQLVLLTVQAIISRDRALLGVQSILRRLGADEELVRIARRSEPLSPHPPPGAVQVETRC